MNFEIKYYFPRESKIPVLHFAYKFINIRIMCYRGVEDFITELENEENSCVQLKCHAFFVHKDDNIISNCSDLYDEYPDRESYWEYKVKDKCITKLIEILKGGPQEFDFTTI